MEVNGVLLGKIGIIIYTRANRQAKNKVFEKIFKYLQKQKMILMWQRTYREAWKAKKQKIYLWIELAKMIKLDF